LSGAFGATTTWLIDTLHLRVYSVDVDAIGVGVVRPKRGKFPETASDLAELIDRQRQKAS